MKKILSRQRQYQIEHKHRGLCILCPKKVAITTQGKKAYLCKDHLDKFRVYQREYARKTNGWKTRYNSLSYKKK